MKILDYYVVDVFTDSRYKGNQLSVVYIDEELDINQYYDISREFGYSETSFVNYSIAENVFKVRSFTKANHEVIGAGHNLLGAVCLALLKEWDIFKHQGTEPHVMIKDDKILLKIIEQDGLPYVGMKQRPAEIVKTVPAEFIAPALGLSVADLDLNGWDINIVKTEVAHLMVPVKNSSLLKNAISHKSLLKKASEKFGFEGCYLFTTNRPDNDILAEARFFNPSIGIDEDPATGTAAGPLAGYLQKLGYISKDKDFRILQGEYVNQPSIIHVKVVDDGIWISGSSVIVMEGKLYL
ncbi:PhzF family phenazine biosynthesis protein [Mucilaginibacter frigoritolerans]|jgi:trans-2,3-dihydro-3-hydroxyanthranilate isomerase|uniref:PhzF family phenazine biosynthesis protein n=1 Tax=Mucilaginibacter frigoritolerans TaxID=652788 RepID=A0A562U2H2_9SPHI|nr:PhzF family phenazine biosynthesis protein [Mucilaginibacter frigoritolerans]TWJ00046.1 PhzF family phenazine biosynthesis protein [Mucilaginibacter frigoritolerans]